MTMKIKHEISYDDFKSLLIITSDKVEEYTGKDIEELTLDDYLDWLDEMPKNAVLQLRAQE